MRWCRVVLPVLSALTLLACGEPEASGDDDGGTPRPSTDASTSPGVDAATPLPDAGFPTGTPLAWIDPAPPDYWYVDALPLSISVAGENVTHYRYQLDGQPMSAEIPLGTPIELTHVAPGYRTITVEGRNALGAWQATPAGASFHMITLEHEDIACEDTSCDLVVPAVGEQRYYAPDDADRESWEVAADLGPGSVVCLSAGTHGRRGFRGFHGSAAAPIRIVNCGGVARVDYTVGAGGAGIALDGVVHVSLAGIGSVDDERGIVINASATGAHGVQIYGGTSHVEVAFIEVVRADNHAIDAKSDSSVAEMCRFNRETFVQENTFLHHAYLHDVTYEAVYAGSSHWERVLENQSCSGTMRNLQEHELHGVMIHDLRVEHAGNDGIQVGAAPENLAVYRNVVVDVATAHDTQHSSGIQIGGGARGRVEGNLVDGAGLGVFIASPGGTSVVNNVFHHVSGHAIVTQDHALLEPDTGFVYVNNTIVASGTCEAWNGAGDTMCWCGDGRALCHYDTHGVGNVFFNNLAPGTPPVNGGAHLMVDANLYDGSHLVDPDGGDYRLRDDSAAIDAGRDVADLGVTIDFSGAVRADGATDIGAFEHAR